MACEYSGTIGGKYLNTGVATLSVTPITMFCWINAAALHAGVIGCINRKIGQGFTDAEHYTFETVSDGTVKATQTKIGAVGECVIGTYTTSTWMAALAEFTTENSRSIYLNAASASDSTAVGTMTLGDVQIGARVIGPSITDIFRGFNGCMEQWCMWEGVLSTNNKSALLGGTAYPNTISPSGIRLYVPQLTGATVVNAYAWDGFGVNPTTDLTMHQTILTCASAPVITPPSTTWKPDIRHY